jgi:ABC-type Na+ transport system ATPase subunit NatA
MASALASPASTLPLKVDDLVKSFGMVKAVSGVSLELRAGECLGLLGPNGAGKSTVIRGIVGRIIPDAGRISIFGFAAGSAEARAALGWVPQDLAVYPRLTCKENLLSFGRYHGLSGSKLDEAVTWCLDWAALQDRASELARNLSGGMKRRLNMAAGIIHRPRVVLMDEPTVGVDPQSRIRIFEMIEALRNGTSTFRSGNPVISACRSSNSSRNPWIATRRNRSFTVVSKPPASNSPACRNRWSAHAESFPPLQLSRIFFILLLKHDPVTRHSHTPHLVIKTPTMPGPATSDASTGRAPSPNKGTSTFSVEAAKLAPRYSHELALVYEPERPRENKNRATLAVARKMVVYMLAVERRKQDFVPAEEFGGTAAA